MITDSRTEFPLVGSTPSVEGGSKIRFRTKRLFIIAHLHSICASSSCKFSISLEKKNLYWKFESFYFTD